MYDWLRRAKLHLNLPYPILDLNQHPQCRLHPPCLKRTEAREMIFLAIQPYFGWWSKSRTSNNRCCIQLTFCRVRKRLWTTVNAPRRPIIRQIEMGWNIQYSPKNPPPPLLFMCVIFCIHWETCKAQSNNTSRWFLTCKPILRETFNHGSPPALMNRHGNWCHQPCAGIFRQSMGARNRAGKWLSYRPSRPRICKRLWSPGIDSEESILPAYVACLLVRQIGLSYRPARLGIDSWAP